MNNKRQLPEAMVDLCNVFCRCGNPESAWAWILDYLHTLDSLSYRAVQGSELIAAYVLDYLQITEHGTSINAAWLTPKGEKVLAFLKVHSPLWAEHAWFDSEGNNWGGD